ncbi:transcription termination factor Rho [uncultured Parolsenella sp.]|uniref:transcription termination factor Rho n=1 Tax=uncultured Parolsenella sp. TaxID=2083008 RepID=UPI0025F44E95|nr:transcription termination factor Rho [uncultured Parolsenella sp.]
MTEDKNEAAQPAKRRRSRTRKVVEQPEAVSQPQAPSAPAADAPAPKRRKARQRKDEQPAPEQHQAQQAQQQPQTQQAQGEQQPRKQYQRPDRPKQYQQQGRYNNQQNQGRRRGRHNNGGNNNNGNGVVEPRLSREMLSSMLVAELRVHAAGLGVEYVGVRKADLVEAVYVASARAEGFRDVAGVLDITGEGYGFVRTGNYMAGDDDAFVPQQLIKHMGLRRGDWVEGTVRPSRPNDKYPALQKVASINGASPEVARERPRFRDLTPVYPNERLVMEHGKNSITGRAIDLVAPIGKGQRGLIVSPPKAGKTTVLKRICESIAANNPEVYLICLLVDERPEEVTDMQRSIKGDVVASTFDMPADNHTAVSELVIERAKRLVEMGRDVVVVLDSITRLARAYNLAQPASGRILSGGVDSAALYPPKKFLGAARNIENGGSLTILASALVETGSKMDEVIFEEFKGTGNMELKLDRELADKRIFPAIDPVASGTRNEELLIDPELQPFVWGLRRILANMNNIERAENSLVRSLKATATNEEFLIRSAKKAQQSEYADAL